MMIQTDTKIRWRSVRPLMACVQNILVIILITLVLLEGTLQLGKILVAATGRDTRPFKNLLGTKVLTLGDSNTYGLFFSEECAWPARFEAYWNQLHPFQKVSVVNLGYPGMNSSRVNANVEALMDKVQPDWVFVMIGSNDFWTPAEDIDPRAQAVRSRNWKSWILEHSLVLRLFEMFRIDLKFHAIAGYPRILAPNLVLKSVDEQRKYRMLISRRMAEKERKLPKAQREPDGRVIQPVVSEDLTIDGERFAMVLKSRGPKGSLAHLRPNLAAIANRVRARGSQVLLITYPGPRETYARASSVIRRFARKTGLPLIDLQAHFASLCHGDRNCYEYFLFDGHPNEKAYRIAGEYVGMRFEQISSKVY